MPILPTKAILASAAILAIVGTTAAHAQEGADLRLRLAKGSSFTVTQTEDNNVTFSAMGQNMDIKSVNANTFNFSVANIEPDGTYQIMVTLAAFRSVSKDNPLGDWDYDSRNVTGELAMVPALFNGMVGKSFWIQLRPDGTVPKAIGAEKIFDAAAAPVREHPEHSSMFPMVEPQIRGIWTDAVVASRLETIFAYLPSEAGPKALGASWTRNTKSASGAEMKSTLTLAKRAPGTAELTLARASAPPAADPAKPKPGAGA